MTIQTVFIQEAPTKLQGANFKLGPGEKRSFPGGILGRHRKQIIITNDDNASTKLYVAVGDPESATAAGRAQSMVVFNQSSITIFTNDTITLFNPHATQAVTVVAVLEVFYTGAGNLVV